MPSDADQTSVEEIKLQAYRHAYEIACKVADSDEKDAEEAILNMLDALAKLAGVR